VVHGSAWLPCHGDHYLDRQTLSVAAPVLRKELHFGDIEYSRIVFAFMLAYTIMNGVSGPLIDAWARAAATRCAWSGGRGASVLPAFARSPLSLECIAFCWGWRGRQLARRVKVVSEWFPPRAGLGLGHLQQRLFDRRRGGAAAGRLADLKLRVAVRLLDGGA